MKRKVLCWLLVIAMLFAMVPAVVSAANVTINRIGLVGFRYPVVGQTAGENLGTLELSNSKGLTISSASWYDVQRARMLSSSEVFEEGKKYYLSVILNVDEGFIVNDCTPGTINGDSSMVDVAYCTTMNSGKDYRFFSVNIVPQAKGTLDLSGYSSDAKGDGWKYEILDECARLTLTNAELSNIILKGDMEIKLEGNNVVGDILNDSGYIAFHGSGRLECKQITAGNPQIENFYAVRFFGGVIEAEAIEAYDVSVYGGYITLTGASRMTPSAAVWVVHDFDIIGGYMNIKCQGITPREFGIYSRTSDVDVMGGYLYIDITDPNLNFTSDSGSSVGIYALRGVWNYTSGGVLVIEDLLKRGNSYGIVGEFHACSGVSVIRAQTNHAVKGTVLTTTTSMKVYNGMSSMNYTYLPLTGNGMILSSAYTDFLFAKNYYVDDGNTTTSFEFGGTIDSAYFELSNSNRNTIFSALSVNGAVLVNDFGANCVKIEGTFSGASAFVFESTANPLTVNTNDIQFNGTLVGSSSAGSGIYFTTPTSYTDVLELNKENANIIGICNGSNASADSGIGFTRKVELSSGNVIGLSYVDNGDSNVPGISFYRGARILGGNVTGYSENYSGIRTSYAETSNPYGMVFGEMAAVSGISENYFGIEFTEKYEIADCTVRIAASSGMTYENSDRAIHLWNSRTYKLPEGSCWMTGNSSVHLKEDSECFGKKANFEGEGPRYSITYYYVTDEEELCMGVQLKRYNVTGYVDEDMNPSYLNHTLIGYNTKADGSGDEYLPGDPITVNADIELYTIWRENRPTLDLTQYAPDASASGDGWIWDGVNRILTLRGVHFHDVILRGSATVNIVGYNVIDGSLINRLGSTTITGSGYLKTGDIMTYDYATDDYQPLTITGGYIEAEHISAVGDFVIKGGALKVETSARSNYYTAVYIYGGFDIYGGEFSVKVTNPKIQYGIYCTSDVDILGGYLNVTVPESEDYYNAGIYAESDVWNYSGTGSYSSYNGGVLVIEARGNARAIVGDFYPLAGVSQFFTDEYHLPISGKIMQTRINGMHVYEDYEGSNKASYVLDSTEYTMNTLEEVHTEYVFAYGYVNVDSDKIYSGTYSNCYVKVNNASLNLKNTSFSGALLIRSAFDYDTTASAPTISGTPVAGNYISIVSISNKGDGIVIKSPDLLISGTIVGMSNNMNGIVFDGTTDMRVSGNLHLIGDVGALGQSGIVVNQNLTSTNNSMIGIGNDYGINFKKKVIFSDCNITGIHTENGSGCGISIGSGVTSSSLTSEFNKGTSVSGIAFDGLIGDPECYGIRFCMSTNNNDSNNEIGAYSNKYVTGVADKSIHINTLKNVNLPEGTVFKSNVIEDGAHFVHQDTNYFGPSTYYDSGVTQYVIRYHNNYGTLETDQIMDQVKNYGVAVTVYNYNAERTGYTFVGWNTERDGSGLTYYPGDEFARNQFTDLYAMWEIETYYFHGTIITEGVAADDITITITEYGMPEPAYELVLYGDDTTWGIINFPYGLYEIVASQNGCLDSVYMMVVDGEHDTLEIVLSTRKVTFALYYTADDTDPIWGDEFPYGSKNPDVAEPGREDAVFVGWYTDRACRIPYSTDGRLYSDVNVFGKWLEYSDISGTISAEGSGQIRVSLSEEGAPEPAYEECYPENTTSYVFEDVYPGTYVMTVTQTGCDAVYYTITVEGADVTQNIVLKADRITFTDNGRTLSLADIVYINQYVQIQSNLTNDYIKANGGMLIWNSYVSESNAVYGTQDRLKAGLNYSASGNEFSAQTNGIAAKNYGDLLYMRMYVRLPDGTYEYSDIFAYCVRDYCIGRLRKGSDAQLKKTCYALLEYGAAAQIYFNYKTDALVNEGIATTYSTYSTDWDASFITPLDLTYTAKEIPLKNEIISNGKTLSLAGQVFVNFYYKTTVTNVASAELLYWTSNSETLTYANAQKLPLTMTGKEWKAQGAGIAAKNLGKTVYARAVFVDTNGKAHYSDVTCYSPEEYARSRIQSSTDANLVNLMKKMVVYGEQARIYFNA